MASLVRPCLESRFFKIGKETMHGFRTQKEFSARNCRTGMNI